MDETPSPTTSHAGKIALFIMLLIIALGMAIIMLYPGAVEQMFWFLGG